MDQQERDRHWALVRSLPCMVCGKPGPSTIHHVHGGSIADAGTTKAGGKKTSDWLVIPLCVNHHTGVCGVDSGMGVRTWEGRFGDQRAMLETLATQLGVDLWLKARENPAKTRQAQRREWNQSKRKTRERGSQGSTATPSKVFPRQGR